jgi:integrase/recombinase XerC
MRGQGKQAKILSEPQIRAALAVIATSRHPLRDRTMILLSVKAGMRAKEIACLTWAMVTDAEGAIGDAIHLTNDASKGKRGGRTIPMNTNLREALIALKAERGEKAAPQRRVIYSERGDGLSAAAVQVWFGRLYGKLGFAGASSHSGRRTFITQAARKIIQCGGSLRDVMELAGHASLATTQRYIAGDAEAKRRVVALI